MADVKSSPTLFGVATVQFNAKRKSSSTGSLDWSCFDVNNLILEYLTAFAISIDALNIYETGSSIFD
jgi:hypothetical protein